MMKQAFVEMNKPVIIAVSPCINDALLTYRLTDSLSYGNDEALQWFKVSIMEQ